MHTGEREPRTAVIKRGIQPTGGVVALVAGLREIRTHVARIGCSLIVLQVTSHACCGVEAVITVDVAVSAGARRNRVQSSQREAGAGVIECCVHPVCGVVALVAGLREVRRDVIRVRRALEVLQVATDASCRIQSVIIVDVAISAGAWRHRVQASQGEPRGGVVEFPIGPLRRIVTLLASGRESRVGHRRRCIVVIGLMAADTRRIGDAVVVVDVAV